MTNHLSDLMDKHGLVLSDVANIIQAVRHDKLALTDVADHVPQAAVGEWRDIVYLPGVLPAPAYQVGSWHENLVVNSFAVLLTALCKTGRTPAYAGITHMALGTGLVGWDAGGFPTPLVTDITLVTELARKPLDSVSDINGSNLVVTTGPTGRLLLSCTFNLNEAMGDIREFGLFGGIAATGFTLDQTNQGIMVNHINHAKITKSALSDFTFTRQIRLLF